MKKHGGVLPYRPETGDGEGGSGSDWPAGARRNPIFYFFYFVLFFDLSSPTYFWSYFLSWIHEKVNNKA